MSDPTGWETPFTSWTPSTGIDEDALNRIEGNIDILKKLLRHFFGSFDVTVNTPYFTAPTTVTCNYTIINEMVFISFPSGLESPNQSTNSELQLSPTAGNWPSDILPQYDTVVPCIFKINTHANYNKRPGYMLIPTASSSNIVCYITRNGATLDDGYYVTDFFYESGGGSLKKAVPAQTINYMIETPPEESS